MKPTILGSQRVAVFFSCILRRWLGDDMRQVIARNRAELSPDVCHSHDFCDANMAMLEAVAAFKDVAQDEVDIDASLPLMNEAWDIAKATEFATRIDFEYTAGTAEATAKAAALLAQVNWTELIVDELDGLLQEGKIAVVEEAIANLINAFDFHLINVHKMDTDEVDYDAVVRPMVLAVAVYVVTFTDKAGDAHNASFTDEAAAREFAVEECHRMAQLTPLLRRALEELELPFTSELDALTTVRIWKL
jgi:hypothetical protein